VGMVDKHLGNHGNGPPRRYELRAGEEGRVEKMEEDERSKWLERGG